MSIIAKKTIYNSNFYKAQKSLDISKAKELLKSNLLLVHEDLDSFSEKDAQYIEYTMNLLTQIRKLRESEVALIFSDCEELYLTKKFELAKNLLGFAETIVDYSGLHNWVNKIQILRRKIDRSLEIIRKIHKFYDVDLIQLPIIQIQNNCENLEMLWQEIQTEPGRQDAIHPEIVEEFEQILKTQSEFMENHGIHKLNPLDKSNYTMWTSTKTNLDLKSKENKLKRILTGIEKLDSSTEINSELLKAYRIIQENPYYFSIQQKQEIIEKLEKFETRISLEEEKSSEILEQVAKLVKILNFENALQVLNRYKTNLESLNASIDFTEIDELSLKLQKNQKIYANLLEVEHNLENNNILEAKTSLIRFNSQFPSLESQSFIFPELVNRVKFVQHALLQPFSPEKSNKANMSTIDEFDPFEDGTRMETPSEEMKDLYSQFEQILETQGRITKQELAKCLNISPETLFSYLLDWKQKKNFELIESDIVLKKFKPVSSNIEINLEENFDSDVELKKREKSKLDEDDILESLDDLLNNDI